MDREEMEQSLIIKEAKNTMRDTLLELIKKKGVNVGVIKDQIDSVDFVRKGPYYVLENYNHFVSENEQLTMDEFMLIVHWILEDKE